MDKQLEIEIKNFIDLFLNTNEKEIKTEIPSRKSTEISEKDEKDFNKLLEFVVNTKTGQAGLLFDSVLLKSWNKKLSDVLLDNIEASVLLLKEELK